MQFFLLWEAALSPATHTSVDDKDVFAFQNDTRYKRITWLMNTAVSILWFITLSEILISNHNSAATPHKGRRSRAWKAQIQFKLS